MKASDYIAKYLEQQGVSCVFELSGGMITHMLDSLHLQGKIRLVSMHHEQAAAFAVDGFGRMTGRPAVAMATSGPGATNLLTGIGSCYFDSTPAVFITGQVNRSEQKGNRPIRQLGFQETDIATIAAPITKAAWAVKTPEELPLLLAKAFQTAVSGRPGPVLLDIPMDIQRANIQVPDSQVLPVVQDPPKPIARDVLGDILGNLLSAKKPLILAGGGIRAGQAVVELKRFVSKTGLPVVCSLMGVDVLPYDDELRVGMIGTYGNRWANLALASCDFLLVLGSRLDVRQTGSEVNAFKEGRVIWHVDCDPGEINNRVTGCRAVVSDLKDFLKQVCAAWNGTKFPDWMEWKKEIARMRRQWPDTAELKDAKGINPNEFMHRLSRSSRSAAAYVVDVGQHQMWAAQSLEIGEEQRFFTSGGMGSMGFALPAAIGAAMAVAGRPLVLIAGDGGFQCNIQELQTVVRYGLPLKMVILNNRCHGMVRQFQESYFSSRYTSTYWGYSAPDFARVAEAYGIAGRSIAQLDELETAVQWLWSEPLAPALLEVKIDVFTNVYPKIAFGRPVSEMEPYAKPREIEST